MIKYFPDKIHFCGNTNHSSKGNKKKKNRKNKGKARASGDLNKQLTNRTLCKYFRYGSVDNLITKVPKPPKYNEKGQKNILFNERVNRASQKQSDNSDNDNNQKIHMHIWYECQVLQKYQ